MQINNGLNAIVLNSKTILWAIVILFGIVLMGCFKSEPEKYQNNKSFKITSNQRAQMDVAFFNVFVERGMSPEQYYSEKGSPRGDIVRALAENGFEMAWLAEKFYDFYHVRYRKVSNGDAYWNRIKDLANNGDASAQCFIFLSVEELYKYGDFKPTKSDVENRFIYLNKALAQKQPECLGAWGTYNQKGDENVNHAQNNLYGAEKNCAQCQSRVASFYRRGVGIEKDLSKALCWANEAVLNSDSLDYLYDLRSLKGDISEDSTILNIINYKPKTQCKQPILQIN